MQFGKEGVVRHGGGSTAVEVQYDSRDAVWYGVRFRSPYGTALVKHGFRNDAVQIRYIVLGLKVH